MNLVPWSVAVFECMFCCLLLISQICVFYYAVSDNEEYRPFLFGTVMRYLIHPIESVFSPKAQGTLSTFAGMSACVGASLTFLHLCLAGCDVVTGVRYGVRAAFYRAIKRVFITNDYTSTKADETETYVHQKASKKIPDSEPGADAPVASAPLITEDRQ
jgi:hypothetical protein